MLTVVILAAGKGTRMKDSTHNIPKVCRKIKDKTMIEMVVETALQLKPKNICIIVSKENKSEIQSVLRHIPNLLYLEQKNINGTASAVITALPIYFSTDLLVLLGDVPLIKSSTLSKCIQNECCVLGFQDYDPDNKFGRIFLNSHNKVEKIIEFAEATEEERNISHVNSGMLYLKKENTAFLHLIENNNSKQEYYLTDIVKILRKFDISIDYIEAHKNECLGANTLTDLEYLKNL